MSPTSQTFGIINVFIDKLRLVRNNVVDIVPRCLCMMGAVLSGPKTFDVLVYLWGFAHFLGSAEDGLIQVTLEMVNKLCRDGVMDQEFNSSYWAPLYGNF